MVGAVERFARPIRDMEVLLQSSIDSWSRYSQEQINSALQEASVPQSQF